MLDKNLEQEKAIRSINSNVAVNAGAGTGKTKVLTDRYMYILKNGKLNKGEEIESIVAITFTNKATQEMIERIRLQLSQKMREDKIWYKYYKDFDKANIFTIHGFCSKILRENPIEANVDPYFEILDDLESEKYLNEAILKVLNELKNDSKFIKLMEILEVNNINIISIELANIYGRIRSTGQNICEIKGNLKKYFENLTLDENWIEEIKSIVLYLMESLDGRSKIVKMKNKAEWDIFLNDKYDSNQVYKYLNFINDNMSKNKKEEDKINRLEYLLQKCLASEEKIYEDMYYLVLDILASINSVYEEIKRKKGVLDYEDLQIKVSKLFDNKKILNKYQDKYKYFMIDEFQDTNELQKNIFYKLCSKKKPLDKKNLFIVGDPKQSIYAFRGADASLFYQVMKDMESYNDSEIITLKTNYRSEKGIIKFINKTFEQIMGNRYDHLSYFKDNSIENSVEILNDKNLKNHTNLSNKEFNLYYEADLVAKRIKKLVRNREYEYKDIAILFRATTNNHIYEKALENYNIPYYNTGSKTFFKKQEIIDLINILRLIGNSYDYLSAIGFLRSPMVGLNDDSIYHIFKKSIETDILSLLKNSLTRISSEEEKEKIQNTIDILDYLYSIRGVYKIHELIMKIIDLTLYKESLILYKDGRQKLANVDKFVEIAKNYTKSEFGDIDSFLIYLENLMNFDEGEEILETSNSNVVTLQTIHGSKGLQYKVVIVPELSRSNMAIRDRLIFHKELGLGIKSNMAYGYYNKVKDKLSQEEYEELERILYVAMTRSEEKLILGFQGRNNGAKKLLSRVLDKEDVLNISSIELEKSKIKDLEIIKKFETFSKDRPVKIDSLELKKNKLELVNFFNISQFLDFQKCKRLYFLKYFWKIDTKYINEINDFKNITSNSGEREILNPIKRGHVVHRFCELYNLDTNKDILLENVLNEYELSNNLQIKKQLNCYIENYIKVYSDNYDYKLSEEKFLYKLGNYYISGIIDRINIIDNNVEVIDFKTNKCSEDNVDMLVEYYTPQIQLYSYIIEEMTKYKVIRGRLLFLETGNFKDIDLSKSEINNTIENILEFMDLINRTQKIGDYDKVENDLCNNCEYKNICEKI